MTTTQDQIDITGIDKAELLAALFNNSRQQGMNRRSLSDARLSAYPTDEGAQLDRQIAFIDQQLAALKQSHATCHVLEVTEHPYSAGSPRRYYAQDMPIGSSVVSNGQVWNVADSCGAKIFMRNADR